MDKDASEYRTFAHLLPNDVDSWDEKCFLEVP